MSSFSNDYDSTSDFSKPITHSSPQIRENQILIAWFSNMIIEEQRFEAPIEVSNKLLSCKTIKK